MWCKNENNCCYDYNINNRVTQAVYADADILSNKFNTAQMHNEATYWQHSTDTLCDSPLLAGVILVT